ncbi:hypothetical protein ACLXNF_16755 [Mycobacteroides chelonae]|uniref:hypothetical protein n=1 Tax=Mycobacteroides chelonae TaxID=1774 RepID=UPI0039E80DE5
MRDWRRKRFAIRLDGRFSLAVEVKDQITALGVAVSQIPNPTAARRGVDTIVDAVAEVVHVGSGMISESAATDGQTRRAAADLAARPKVPSITDAMLVSGTWVDALVEYAEQVSDPLSELLGRAHPPGSDALRGDPSASERVERALRGLDQAVLSMERAIPKIRQRQALPSLQEFNRQQRERRDAERAERISRRQSRIGVTT